MITRQGPAALGRCPVCNGRLEEALCTRCGADLTPLFKLKRDHARLLNEAARAFAEERYEIALDLATKAEALRDSRDARRLRCLSALLVAASPGLKELN